MLQKFLSTKIRLPRFLLFTQVQQKLLTVGEKVAAARPKSSPKPEPQLPVPRTPFDKYRLRKLLGQMQLWQVEGMSVLEVGCGVGDLLHEISKFKPKELYGTDRSEEFIKIACQYAEDAGFQANITAASARDLPFPEQSFDLVFLMHEFNTLPDDKLVMQMISELCRVSKMSVVLVEDVAGEFTKIEGQRLRPVEFYKEVFLKQETRFHLRGLQYLDVAASRFIFTSKNNNPWYWMRWIFSPVLWLFGRSSELMKVPGGEQDVPDSKLAIALQKLALPFLSGLDGVVKSDRGIAIMRFEREKLFRRG